MPPTALSPGFQVVTRSAGMIPATPVVPFGLRDKVAPCARSSLSFPGAASAKPLALPRVRATGNSVQKVKNETQSMLTSAKCIRPSDCTNGHLMQGEYALSIAKEHGLRLFATCVSRRNLVLRDIM